MTPVVASLLQVRLFGQFELLQNGVPSSLPPASDARTLLAYLLLHSERACPRSVLADLLAPDLPEVQARHALSQALWHIRRSLPGLLESDASQVGIAPQVEVWVDALEFQALAERCLAGQDQPAAALAGLRQAVELYRSDLLEGYYDEWVLIEREHLRDLYLRVLDQLVIAYKVALQYQQALTIALRLVSADPLNESAHREVMRLYHYLGRPAEALHQYETCRAILRQEFDLEPETETSQIVQAIAQRSGRAAAFLPEPQAAQDGSLLGHQTASAIPLIGRSLERAQLLDWLRHNPSGGGRLVLVEGEAGVGKTRLLQDAARDVEWHGAQVLWGKAMPLTDRRPLEPLVAALAGGLTPLRVEQLQHLVEPVWLQALQPLLPRLAQNLPGLEPLPMLEDRPAKLRLLESLIRLLAAWALINPLVLIIEDVHWADADTVDILIELASRLDQGEITLVCSYRRDELANQPDIQAKLEAIRPEAMRGQLALAGLEAAGVSELIRTSLGSGKTSPAFDERLHQETQGNPLFILEVLRGLYDEGVLRRDESGAWFTPYDSAMGEMALPLPSAVEQVITRRLEQLPEALRELLEGLAVLSGEFGFDEVACLDLVEAPVLVTRLQELTRRRLLTQFPQGYRFSHDKIRQVVYENLEPVQRTTWHARVAMAFEQAHPDRLEALAYHYTQARDWEKAVDYHQRSAEKARRANAFSTALEHLNRALALADQAHLPVEEQFHILEMHVDVLQVLGDAQLCQNDLDVMNCLAGDDPLQIATTRQKHIEFLIQTSHYTEAEITARQALSLAENQGDRLFQAAALTSLGKILDIHGERESATAFLERSIHLYQQLGDRRGEAEARGYLANVLAKSEQRAAARAEFEAVLALYEVLDYKPGCADTLAVLGVLSDFDGDYEASIRYCTRALEICRAIGYRIGEAYASHEIGSALQKLGQIGQSFRVLQDAKRISLAIGERRLEAVTRIFLSGIFCSYIGDYESGFREIEAGLAIAQSIGDPILEARCLSNWGDALLGAGKLKEAIVQQERALTILKANDGGLRMPEVYLSLAFIYLHDSQPQAALENLENADALSRKFGLNIYTGSLLDLRAEILLGLDRPEEALEFIKQAISGLSPSREIYYHVYFVHYEIVNKLGRSAEARQALERAYQGLTNMLAGLSPEQQEMSRTCIPEHAKILQAWQASQPRRIVVRLPSASASLGRPLRADEWVQASWTIAAPEDEAIPGKVERRRARLLRLLQEARAQGAAPTSENLSQTLGVSVRTIVADLKALKLDNDQLLRASLRGLTKV